MKRVVVIAGGEVSPEDLHLIQSDDFLITADAGVEPLLDLGMRPHLAVGDFDTTKQDYLFQLQDLKIPYRTLPREKDVTDTHFALEEAVKLQPSEILLLGALGGSRFDHALANLYLLEWIATTSIPCTLVSGKNQICLLVGPTTIRVTKGDTGYISLLPCSDQVVGVTLKGFRYPLNDATLIRGVSLGVSNEIAQESGEITIRLGKCFCMQSADR
ncbi:thiamine diphosphokinase [Thermoactinomyces sp. DSM 45892]|uniref:thiamine diphosphokinase n=1 Tax=Thermoactinomyces sp. DSM 45892 TaxID=1882753 RepID=UPI00089A89A2|nr:thiamine diphosphokinase [Thermoactinomyces sp. DSM 45892]SDY57255.1 thiamine pyrophosphokinase [Thermoactinomyces sp. DSM 45892]